MANYACNFDSVNCLAHELGHAFHNYCMKGLPMKQRKCPMTLAETASIMDEMIVSESALKEAQSKEEELYILESAIASTSGVIVDIASRFLFEKEVMERTQQNSKQLRDDADNYANQVFDQLIAHVTNTFQGVQQAEQGLQQAKQVLQQAKAQMNQASQQYAPQPAQAQQPAQSAGQYPKAAPQATVQQQMTPQQYAAARK